MSDAPEILVQTFDEAFMKLVRERLSIRTAVYHTDRGKIQVRISLEDRGSEHSPPREIAVSHFTIASDLQAGEVQNYHVSNSGG